MIVFFPLRFLVTIGDTLQLLLHIATAQTSPAKRIDSEDEIKRQFGLQCSRSSTTFARAKKQVPIHSTQHEATSRQHARAVRICIATVGYKRYKETTVYQTPIKPAHPAKDTRLRGYYSENVLLSILSEALDDLAWKYRKCEGSLLARHASTTVHILSTHDYTRRNRSSKKSFPHVQPHR